MLRLFEHKYGLTSAIAHVWQEIIDQITITLLFLLENGPLTCWLRDVTVKMRGELPNFRLLVACPLKEGSKTYSASFKKYARFQRNRFIYDVASKRNPWKRLSISKLVALSRICEPSLKAVKFCWHLPGLGRQRSSCPYLTLFLLLSQVPCFSTATPRWLCDVHTHMSTVMYWEQRKSRLLGRFLIVLRM